MIDDLKAEISPHKGTIVIMYHMELVRLIDVIDGEDDIYYVARPFGVPSEVTYYSAAGGYIPLKGYIPDDEYAIMDRLFKLNGEESD